MCSTISNFSERFLTANILTLEEQIGREKKFFVFLKFFTTKHFFSSHFTIWKTVAIYSSTNTFESASELILITDSLKTLL